MVRRPASRVERDRTLELLLRRCPVPLVQVHVGERRVRLRQLRIQLERTRADARTLGVDCASGMSP